MSGILKPRMEILPAIQRKLWQDLRPTTELGMVLYGGTPTRQ
jgi:hypothetical protein